MAGKPLRAPDEQFSALSENFKDSSIKANNATNQSNFAGTKYWAGGSSKISDFAGSCKYNEYASSQSHPNGPGRHPEGVKGGNSDFKF